MMEDTTKKNTAKKLSEKFLQVEFALCKTDFKILPLNAFDAYTLLEYIREHVGVNLLQFDVSNIASCICSVIATKTMHIEHVRQTLFSRVRYQLATSNEGKMIENRSDIDQAFQHGNAGDIYELLVRCVFVNFFSTFKRLSETYQTL